MPPKTKGTDIVSNAPEPIDQISLRKYCPKEVFDILFLSEADEYSKEVVDNVVETGRNYEDISCLTFISYNEVIDLVQNYEKVILPPRVKATLEDVCQKIQGLKEIDDYRISSRYLAQLMKLKLIHVMYQHYISEVMKMQKRKKLEEDLNILTKECKKSESGKGKGKGEKGNKGGKDSKSGKSTATGSDKKKGKDKGSAKGEEVKVVEDYTQIPIERESDVIFDDDIFNHVWFYAFYGFYDPELMQELNSINVPLTAVIKITSCISDNFASTITSSETLTSLYEEYWNRLYIYFDGPGRLEAVEDTILMNFASSSNDVKETFQQLLYVIKNISDIKLQHVNYLRYIQIYEIKEIYKYFPLECLNTYNKAMDKIPFELVNEPILLNNLLQEVCVRVDNAKSSTSIYKDLSNYSMRSQNSYSTTNCVNPCNIDAFFKSKHKPTPEKILPQKYVKTFLTHECDEINIILNTYKKYGPLLCDPVLKLLKTLRPFDMLNEYLTDYSEILHKHDIDPSTKMIVEDEELIMHIFYLIFFNTFDCTERVFDFKGTELTENLETYQTEEFVKSAQTSILDIIHSDEVVLESAKSEEQVANIEEIIEEEENFHVMVEESIFPEINHYGEEINSHDDPQNKSLVDSDILFPNYYKKSALQYFWKEKLPPDVLIQEIYKAQNQFSYMEQKFSPGTDNLVLQFSDCLDEFGIKTKIFDQSLVTPICLRDFCRYVSVQEADWLDKNKPPKYFRKCEEIEVCKGVKRINQLQLFQEYSHLLDSTIKSENEEEKQKFNENSVSFEELLQELMNYPHSSRIIEECKKSQKEKTFLAYDLGVQYFQVRGAKTTFHSHDDVKVIVENTRFLDEEPKCTVSLSSKANSLVLHSNKFYLCDDYTFHMHLADGTIITFIVLNSDLRKSRRKASQSEIDEPSMLEEKLSEKNLEEEPEILLGVEDEVMVLSIDRDHFNGLEEHNLKIEEEDVDNTLEVKDNEAIFDCLKQATMLNIPIYKVSNNLTHLKRLKSEVEIPLTNILNRVLHKAIQKKNFKSFTKRYIPKRQKPSRVKRMFDARIAWPNGLYVSFYPSEVKSTYVEVKQEFLTKNLDNSLIQQEEFRLFARDGYILIKHIDGTIRILKSNGDIIDFEKLDVNSDLVRKWRLRPCHCKTINDYRKKLNRIMKKNSNVEEEGATAYPSISRRGQFRTKKGYVLNPDLVNMLQQVKVPYLKHTLLKFNGNRICLENGRVTQKRLFHITDEQDFFAQEIYYERSDGLRSYFDRHGKQQVKFADGTKITSTLHVAKQLASGYVYVSLSFEYQHPNYATVLYTHDNSLEVMLKGAIFKMDIKDTIYLNIGEDILTTVKKNSVMFNKTCPRCNSKYKCLINVKPFNEENFYNSETFLHAQDSYNKHFSCDYLGNCRRNANYIKGPFNIFNCNHYKKMVYKKMFVVNRNMSGYLFWTDDMVDTKRKTVAKDKDVTVTECNDVNDGRVKVVKIRRNVFDSYSNRYLNTGLLEEQMCLAKYKREEVKQLIYTTSRVIKKLTDFTGIKKVLADVMMFFINFGSGTKLLNNLEKMLKENDSDSEGVKSVKEIVCEIVEPPICKCVKEKIDMAGKIKRWQGECKKYRELIRNNVINPYFSSEFCQIVDENDISKSYDKSVKK